MHRFWSKAFPNPNLFRAFSSAGSEHLPYKQRVGGSNPSTPTFSIFIAFILRAFSSAGSEHLPYKQRVGGSNPSTPTIENQALTINLVGAFLLCLCLQQTFYIQKFLNLFISNSKYFSALKSSALCAKKTLNAENRRVRKP